MSWTDEEIDKLFQESAKELSFKYDNAYFKEFEAAALPVNKKGKDFLWMGTALVFIGMLTTAYFFTNGSNSSLNETNIQLAATDGTNTSSSASSEQSTVNQANTSTNQTEFSTEEPTATAKAKVQPSQVPAKSKSIYPSTVGSPSVAKAGTNQSGDPSTSSLAGNASTTSTSIGERIAAGSGELPNAIQLLNDGSAKQVASLNATENSSNVGDVAELVPNKANGIDNVIPQELGTIAMPPLGQITPKTVFYLEATGGVSQSLVTPSENFSNSYGAGFGCETHFGQFSLNSGLNFNVSNHQDLELTRAGKVYSFGSTTTLHNYNYKNVYAIEMPISLGYNFGKHRLTLGVRPSYVIGAKIDHLTFEDESLTRSERIYGLAGGLQQFGIKPMIGYSFHVQQKWTIGVNVGVQLLRAINEEFINGFNNPTPIDGQIYLRRTIRLRNY